MRRARIRLAPRSGAARAWLSESYRKLGRYEDALAALDRAVELEPAFALAWVWRGRLRLLQGKPALALKDLDRAVKLDARYQGMDPDDVSATKVKEKDGKVEMTKGSQKVEVPEGTTAADGASWFVNPLTALGMTETMRREGHKALVHTAAASNLGQMLNKICLKDGIGLVNIVRSEEQAALLRKLGAKHVVDSSNPGFMDELTNALAETGATIAFDAIGGGKLAGQILTAMEAAINKTAKVYSRYGSNVHKQVYVYGGLDIRPIELNRAFGMAWGVGGWLLFPFLMKIGAADGPPALLAHSGQQPASRLYRVHIQTPVHQLLACFRQGTGSLDVRENSPVSIRNAADKLPHEPQFTSSM